MNGVATITAERIPPSIPRPEGATISEFEYLPSACNKRMSQSRLNRNWLQDVSEDLERLVLLPPGWDSNGAGPVEAEVESTALRLIEGIAYQLPGLARPKVVTATRSGGIQFEWGRHDAAYFELECVSPTEVEYYFVDRREAVEEQGEFTIEYGEFPGTILNYVLQAIHGT